MFRIAAVLVVLCTFVLGLRLVYENHPGTASRSSLSTPDNSDYYMTDATAYQMDGQGHLAYQVTSAQALHFPDDSARLKNIDVHYLKNSKTRWEVTAALARVPAGRHDVYLYDGVKARHPLPGGRALSVVAEHAWVHPKRNRIDSQAQVKAIAPGHTTRGDGMQINLDTDKLRLLKNVHVTFTP